jgi:2-methylcitrate dehydratase PrpD
MSISQQIAAFSINTERALVPESARAIARLSVIDWIAVAIAGRDEPVSQIVRQMLLDEGGAPQASVIGSQVKLSARAAALCNGATSHALDYDDTHFIYLGHPSVAVIPATLALAEKIGTISIDDFLDACLIGCEVACRVGAWLGREHYQLGFHATATAGSFGATAAACRILGLSAEQTTQALGLCATRSSGIKAQFGTMGKPYHAGMAASNGVEVATLAGGGFISNPDAIDALQGFSAMHAATVPTPWSRPCWKHATGMESMRSTLALY